MRKYKYSQISSPAPDGLHTNTKLYTIYLAPRCQHKFKSYKAARQFAAQYSKDINRTMHTYNLLLAELYAGHRAAWFYYFDKATGKNSMDIEKNIAALITEAEKELYRAAHNCSGTHIAGNIWQVIQRCCEHLQAGFTQLAAFLFARRLYAEAEKMKIYSAQAENEIARICGLYSIELL